MITKRRLTSQLNLERIILSSQIVRPDLFKILPIQRRLFAEKGVRLQL